MVSVDGSVFIQIINFLFLIWVLNIVLYKPIRNVLLQRKEKVDGMEQQIESLSADAREKDEAFDGGIRAARTEGLKQKDALVGEAGEEEKQIIGEINAKYQADLTALREKIAADADGVRQELEKEIDLFADAIGQKILGRAI